jgi:hypothetical protein
LEGRITGYSVVNERIGQVVDSPSWIVVYAQKVKDFRETLSPREAELFDECCKWICLDPQVDDVHKFHLPAQIPAASLLYRDDDFVLTYYPSQVTKPFKAPKIEVFKAKRARDFE